MILELIWTILEVSANLSDEKTCNPLPPPPLYDDSMGEIYIHHVCIEKLFAASLLIDSPASLLHLNLDLHLI